MTVRYLKYATERVYLLYKNRSVDTAARCTEQNDLKIYSEKSKEVIISFAQDGNFRSTIPNIKIDRGI